MLNMHYIYTDYIHVCTTNNYSLFFYECTFGFWAAALHQCVFCLNFVCFLVLGETFIPTGAHQPWAHSELFGNEVTLHCKLRVKSWFCKVSLISVFSLEVDDFNGSLCEGPQAP